MEKRCARLGVRGPDVRGGMGVPRDTARGRLAPSGPPTASLSRVSATGGARARGGGGGAARGPVHRARGCFLLPAREPRRGREWS